MAEQMTNDELASAIAAARQIWGAIPSNFATECEVAWAHFQQLLEIQRRRAAGKAHE